MSPPQAPETAEERLEQIERLIGHVIAKAREHPVGRKILVFLGLK